MAEQHYQPRSKGTWGKEEAKTAEELNRLCNEFFDNLVVPPEWKFMGWDPCIDNGLVLSVGRAFRDMRTSGIDLMHYRVWFNSFSTRGGVCSRSIIDFGKFKYHSEVGNKTVEKLNEWIAERYNELKPLTPEGEQEQPNDNSDGLQHFRDRFNNPSVNV